MMWLENLPCPIVALAKQFKVVGLKSETPLLELKGAQVLKERRETNEQLEYRLDCCRNYLVYRGVFRGVLAR